MPRKLHPHHPTMRNPEFAKKVFDFASEPRSWLSMARNLRHSADAIFERENRVAQRFMDEIRRLDTLGDTEKPEEWDEAAFPHPNFAAALMLVAFAIENLLKGLVVAKGLAPFTGQRLPRPLQTHELYRLHNLASPTATISRDTLEFLSNISMWRGRYPLPVSIEQFWRMDDKGQPMGMGYSPTKIQTEFSAYCDGLEAELRGLL